MELGEADQPPMLVSKEQIATFCYDLYFMSEKVFGSAFLNSPALTYYTNLSTEDKITGFTESEAVDLEMTVSAQIDSETGQPRVASYTLCLTSSEESSVFPEYNVSSTIEYTVLPNKNKVEITTKSGFVSKDNAVIIYDFADDELILKSISSQRRRRVKSAQVKKLNKKISTMNQTDLDQLYDFMRAFGYVEHQD